MTKIDEELAELLRSPSAAAPVVILTPSLWHGRCDGDPRCGACSLCRAEAKVSIAGDLAHRSEKHEGQARAGRRWRWPSPESAIRAWVYARERVASKSTLGQALDSLRLGLPLGGSGVPSSGGQAEQLGVDLAEVSRSLRRAVESWHGALHADLLLRVVEALLVGIVPERRGTGRPKKRDEHGRVTVSTKIVASRLGQTEDEIRAALSHVCRTLAVDLAVVGLLRPPSLGSRERVEVATRIEASRRKP